MRLSRRGFMYPARHQGRIMNSRIKNGYILTTLDCKTKLVHRLVCEAFLSSFSAELEVNHKNAIKGDNRVCNLEMCTPKGNAEHAKAMGLRKKSPTGKNLLTPEERAAVRFFYVRQRGKGAFVSRALAKIFDISVITIGRISKESRA